jgi:transglutaminase-like putative cysteine protease
VNSYLVYRASFYLMLTVATTALSADGAETPLARSYPWVMALAGIVAFVTVDRHRQWALPRIVANALALVSLGALYFEYKVDDTQVIRALGHWLIYLQLILYFLPKTAEDDWFLFTLGLMQVLIGSVTNQSDQIGNWLFIWAMLAVWVLGQFFLQRESRRFLATSPTVASLVSQPGSVDVYTGLFDLPYVVSTVRILATTLALGGLIFLMLPRSPGATRTQAGAPMTKHLTGFDEEVQLGQLGEILENDTVVMTVEFLDRDGKTIRLDDEPLWRGATMLHYDHGRWSRQSQRPTQTVESFPSQRDPNIPKIRQRIKLEPNDSTTLFAIRPILNAGARRTPPFLNPLDGTLYRPDTRGGPYDYQVDSDPDPDGLQVSESPPSPYRVGLLLEISEHLKQQMKKIAEPVVANIDGEGRKGILARSRKLEAFLRNSGQFSYSLQMDVKDRSLDPVEDFLVNRKEGHCEYFASALALLLRSVDIPSRIVNGFKGGDWNELTQTMTVRQKHAHSWVEAFAGLGPQNIPIWITLDPTPAFERQQSIAQVGGVAGSFRPLTDVFRHIWIFYIVGYDGDRQDRLLYQPMREMIKVVREKWTQVGEWIKTWLTFLFHFRDVTAFVSIRGFIVSFFVLILLAAFAYLVFLLTKRVLRWLHGPTVDSTSLTAGILFYRRLVQLLAEYELERTPAETQSEFAVRAHKFLIAKGPLTQGMADVPRQVVDAFYRVRFGHLEIEPDSLQQLDARLDALETSLKSP